MSSELNGVLERALEALTGLEMVSHNVYHSKTEQAQIQTLIMDIRKALAQ